MSKANHRPDETATEAPRWRAVRACPLGGEHPTEPLVRELRELRDALCLFGRQRAALRVAEALLEVKRRRTRAAA